MLFIDYSGGLFVHYEPHKGGLGSIFHRAVTQHRYDFALLSVIFNVLLCTNDQLVLYSISFACANFCFSAIVIIL